MIFLNLVRGPEGIRTLDLVVRSHPHYPGYATGPNK
ncbi:uncharacterized protein METZ01_LOCUS175297 [marine metagenome]|uniref:Uncharacterized protein n=1 Tax=marine metagenome TaxID=408172 RepID=A0A382CB06_9ZZZZ